MSTSTTGTGTITLGSAEDGYQTFADAGVANSDVVRYVIEDGSNFEIGTGTYTSSGTTLTRTVSESSNSDAAINLSGSATVFIGATAEDIPALYADSASGSAVTPTANTGGAYNSVAIGNGADIGVGRGESIAIGTNSFCNQSQAIALGHGATTSGFAGVTLGRNATATSNYATAIGPSYASGTDSLAAAITNNTSSYGATGTNSIALGELAKATNTDSVAIGSGASATGSESMALHKGSLASGLSSTALGYGAYATATNSIALGTSAYAYGAGGAALGRNARSYGEYAVGLANSYATNSNSLAGAIGTNSSSYGAKHDYGVAFGYQAVTTADKQIALGSGTAQVKVSGAYTLPTADGSANQVLQTDGSGALSFATVSGGGGDPDLYRDNASSATTPTASGTNAVAIGTNAIASNTESVALGGDTLSSGYKSFGAVIGNSNSAYGATGYAAISIGLQSRATASDSIALGPSSYASGTNSLTLGYASTASGTNSIAVGNSTSNAYLATSFGEYALSESQGKYSYASGRFGSTEGSAQTGTYVLRADTTDATPEGLTTRNNGGVQSDNQVNLPNNSAYFFSGTCIAREQAADGTDVGAWEFKGAIRREANAGTTTLIKSTIDDFNVPTGWAIALSADTTNGALQITVTGAASTDIRWVATVQTSEVIYA